VLVALHDGRDGGYVPFAKGFAVHWCWEVFRKQGWNVDQQSKAQKRIYDILGVAVKVGLLQFRKQAGQRYYVYRLRPLGDGDAGLDGRDLFNLDLHRQDAKR
jgi:hypothetical protein